MPWKQDVPVVVDGVWAKEMVLGYGVDSRPLVHLSEEIVNWVVGGNAGKSLFCANPHSLEVARTHPDFAAALRNAHWLVPDGAGIVLASRLLGGTIRHRVTGSDIFLAVNRALDHLGGRGVFFLGSTPDNLEMIRRRFEQDYPRLKWAGAYSPPFVDRFDEKENQRIRQLINSSAAEVLWVGLTAPKQELWIAENLSSLQVRFAGAVGAVFDFYSGRVRRSGYYWQRLGLEWLPRLLHEPQRLWRRNLVSSPCFMLRVIGSRLFQNNDAQEHTLGHG